MPTPKVLIAHGAYGHPKENWFDWLKQELAAHKVPCQVPHFPTPEGQSLKNWLPLFNRAYGNDLSSKPILIGHSLGAAFLLRWLELHPVRPKAVILVGAFIGEVGISKFDSINKDFFCKPLDWRLLRERSDQFICYHGDDDPYVSKEHFDFIADQLLAKKIIISKGGHLNEAAGYKQFPQLLLHLKKLWEQA